MWFGCCDTPPASKVKTYTLPMPSIMMHSFNTAVTMARSYGADVVLLDYWCYELRDQARAPVILHAVLQLGVVDDVHSPGSDTEHLAAVSDHQQQ